MNTCLKRAMLLGVLLCPVTALAGLVVTSTDDEMAIAERLLDKGSGLKISSVSLLGAKYQQGFFDGGLSAGIGLDSGVLLTTGRATNAVGPNQSDSKTKVVGSGGDSDLDGLISSVSTYDANVLQLDFSTTTGGLFFNYVFASEEYNEYAGSSFNDVFGFFIDGVNIALLPGSSDPVAVNTVNLGSPYFNDNDLDSFAKPPFDIEYDGFTDVFTAGITGLEVGTLYTLKLAVADAGDRYFDSAVFLQSGSFSSVALASAAPVPSPAPLALLAIGLCGFMLVPRRAVVTPQESSSC
ncbi:choice-of-anchor L domain-containing protein [Marichromatium purpuratum]|uniref:choice-of-anchor L domain-containing protein n=1 Tax=Marichromatium purpuratum TaxID=37487 RepID=UPI00021E5B89|nr:choice-of-anchor L domain-containing protein [Marichromatium purpuratum]